MNYKIVIPDRLPNLNDYTAATRANRYKGAQMKRDAQEKCEMHIKKDMRGIKITEKIRIRYKWFEKDTRRDIDNVSGFGHKVIQDALVSCGVIPDDNQRYITGYIDEFYVDKENPRIEVIVEELPEGKLLAAIEKMPKDNLIAVGANSAFIFIGTAGQFLQDLEELDATNIRKAEITKKNALAEKRYLMANGGKVSYYDKYGRLHRKEWSKVIDDMHGRLYRDENSYEEMVKYLKNYTSLADRKIKEVYTRSIDEAIVFLIEGSERGEYWTREEYAGRQEE